MILGTFPTFYIQITISYADDTSVLLNGKDYAHLVGLLNPCSAAPGCTRIAETHPTAAPGCKKKKKFFFFFFKMFNGKDSDMLVVIVRQYCSA